jgi:hypothetical protein
VEIAAPPSEVRRRNKIVQLSFAFERSSKVVVILPGIIGAWTAISGPDLIVLAEVSHFVYEFHCIRFAHTRALSIPHDNVGSQTGDLWTDAKQLMYIDDA